MSDDYNSLKKQINTHAAELVALNPNGEDSEEICKKQMAIWEMFNAVGYSFVKTDSVGNDWYVFPLLENLLAPWESVYYVIDLNLRTCKKTGENFGLWNFKPESGDFITTIIKEAKFCVKRGIGLLNDYIPEIEDDETGERYEEPSTEDHAEDIVNRLSSLDEIRYIAELIMDRKWLVKGKINKQHFEGYFTHDRVAEEKASGGVYINDEYSEALFPAMCDKMLIFLMSGSFVHMYDLANNPLRAGINLSQCVQNVGVCYNMGSMSKYYHGQYKEWLKSIKR